MGRIWGSSRVVSQSFAFPPKLGREHVDCKMSRSIDGSIFDLGVSPSALSHVARLDGITAIDLYCLPNRIASLGRAEELARQEVQPCQMERYI